MSRGTLWVGLGLLLVIGFAPTSCKKSDIAIGSKKFTESVILGELLRLQAKSQELEAIHYQQLGGTPLVFNALQEGDLDLYPEYTGTLTYEILKLDSYDEKVVTERLDRLGLAMSKPLGFNNTYALGMKRESAERLGIETISDLNRHPELVLRFSTEFVERKDGWKPLKEAYGLAHNDVRGIDHDVAYRELDSGSADVIDIYSTDSKIEFYDVAVLKDDLSFFPRYDAIVLYRQDRMNDPRFEKLVRAFEGQIDEEEMKRLNADAELLRESEAQVAVQFLKRQFDTEVVERPETRLSRLWKNTVGHLNLVRGSLVAAILVGIPLGIIATRMRRLGAVILTTVGIIQTLPGLALLVLLIAPVNALGLNSLGNGSMPVLIALFGYSLLPIVRNVHVGISNISSRLIESADALGLTPTARLFRIELPIAMPTILAGIRTAAVFNVGFATLGALIGAPGYGQPMLAGIRLANTSLILEGAIPAALLAVTVEFGFAWISRFLVSKGLQT